MSNNEFIFITARANPQADTKNLEKEIDQLALRGQLYGLTEDEIGIIESTI